MKNKLPLLPLTALLLSILACNLSLDAVPTLSQQQTLAAGGNTTPGVLPGDNPVVPAGPADTPTNTMLPTVTWTGTPLPSPTYTPTVTQTPVPCNWVQFITDVTIADNWETTPNDHFIKTWRLKNIGSCTWTSGYALVFDHGDQMNAPAAQQLTPGTVPPGGTIDVSVELLSPAATGTYQGYFKLRASDSSVFGIGPAANGAFWVKIKVVAPLPAIAVSQYENSVVVAPGESKNVIADCPAGSVIVGGGFDGNTNLSTHNMAKSGNGWSVWAKNYSASNKTLKALAFCLTGASVSAAYQQGQVDVPGGSNGNQNITCPAGSVLSGLGYAGTAGDIWIYRSDSMGNTHRVQGKNLSGSPAILRASSVCLTGAGATTVQATNNGTVPSGMAATLDVVCPAGTVVTGGGFALNQPLVVTGISKKSGANAIAVDVLNLSPSSLAFNGYAMCLAIS
jgi:hypothetical protein